MFRNTPGSLILCAWFDRPRRFLRGGRLGTCAPAAQTQSEQRQRSSAQVCVGRWCVGWDGRAGRTHSSDTPHLLKHSATPVSRTSAAEKNARRASARVGCVHFDGPAWCIDSGRSDDTLSRPASWMHCRSRFVLERDGSLPRAAGGGDVARRPRSTTPSTTAAVARPFHCRADSLRAPAISVVIGGFGSLQSRTQAQVRGVRSAVRRPCSGLWLRAQVIAGVSSPRRAERRMSLEGSSGRKARGNA